MYRIKNPSDVMAGIFFVMVACLGFYLLWPLNSGNAAEMGAGYLPKRLCVILAGLGVAIIANGVAINAEPSERVYVWPLFWILLAIAAFSASIERFGLLLALVGLVLIGCIAYRGTKWRDAVVLTVGVIILSWGVFVKAIGLPIPIWPQT